ncbi:MAG: hypothetical protein ACLQVM_21330 [Terriglobia bacterium]
MASPLLSMLASRMSTHSYTRKGRVQGVHRQQHDVIDCTAEEKRVLREQLGCKRLRLNDD